MAFESRWIRLGVDTADELRRRLAAAQVRMNELAEALWRDPRFTIAHEPRDVQMTFATPAALGCAEGATFEQLTAAAARHALQLAPLEAAVHLRLLLTDQPEGAIGHPATKHRAPPGAITVMSPPPEEDDQPWGFYLRRIEGRLWLRGYRSWAGHVFSADDVLAFAVETAHPA